MCLSDRTDKVMDGAAATRLRADLWERIERAEAKLSWEATGAVGGAGQLVDVELRLGAPDGDTSLLARRMTRLSVDGLP